MSQVEVERFHRETAKKCFNETWDYLDKKDRDTNDEQQMLHLVHSSRYHWSFVGDERNIAVSDWQVSRVYSALNEAGLALHFAKSSVDRMEKNKLSDILCTGYEAMARALAVAKNYDGAKDYINRARDQLAKAHLDEEDNKIYRDQIKETEQLIHE
jgi:hypothetical protein